MFISYVMSVERVSKKKKLFQNPHCEALFTEYLKRTEKFIPVDVKGATLESLASLTGAVWVCHGTEKQKVPSSVELSKKLNRVLVSGVKELTILIGPPNGFTENDLKRLPVDFQWSFGPMTLPHELALVVASEQIYRAFSILKGLPYHLEH